jgi:hypothetical protein
MDKLTIKEIENLATWAESITTDAPDDMGFPVAALDLKRFASALRHLLSERQWRPISEAPTDGTLILVYAPAREGLSAMQSVCAYHPDAGFCIDELREPTHFMELPAAPEEENGDV